MTRVALVTGAAGGIGRRLVTALQHNGWRVRALVHRSPVLDADEHVLGSLLDTAACGEAVRGCDAVVHLAALTHARERRRYETVNVDGTRTLVEAMEQANARRLLFVSSRAAVPGAGWYGTSKLAAEAIVVASRLDWTILRLPEVYGASGAEGIDDIIARARTGRPILLAGDGCFRVCPLHVDDAVAACVAAVDATVAHGKTYTLGGRCTTLAEFAETCVALARERSRIVNVPWALLVLAASAARVLPLPLFPDQPARLAAPKPDPSPEVSDDLGLTPRSLDAGLPPLI